MAEVLDFSARTKPTALPALPEAPAQACPASTIVPHAQP
jgi:hypothetical protein